jgi:hypothetical protein
VKVDVENVSNERSAVAPEPKKGLKRPDLRAGVSARPVCHAVGVP